MKSITLSMNSRSVSQPPSILFVPCGPLDPELLEVRADVLARGGHQRRVETMIDAFRNRLHGRVPRAQRVEDLRLAHAAMIEIAGQEHARIVDARAVRGKQHARRRSADRKS